MVEVGVSGFGFGVGGGVTLASAERIGVVGLCVVAVR